MKKKKFLLKPFSSHLKTTFEDVYKVRENEYKNLCYQNESENEVNIFISNIQQQVFPYYKIGDFDKILDILLQNFPNFFEGLNYNFLYILRKLTFFKMLSFANQKDIKKFYFETLLRILKEVKPKNWKEKDAYFQRILINPGLFLKDNILEKYYEQFMFELDKAIRTFLVDDSPRYYDSEDIYQHLDFLEDSEIQLPVQEEEIIDTSTKKKPSKKLEEKKTFKEDSESTIAKKRSETNQTGESNSQPEAEEADDVRGKYEIAISDRSTKEEFSDFEDEFTAKFNNLNSTLQKDLQGKCNVHYERPENLKEEEILPQEDIQFYPNEEKQKKPTQEKKNESQIMIISTPASQIASINRFIISQKNIWKDIPFTLTFKPKFAKREIINKKILRQFCNFVKQNNNSEIGKEFKDLPEFEQFYIIFINGNFLPPLKFHHNLLDEFIYYKTFNDCYLFYIFSIPFVLQFYQFFLSQKFSDLFEEICQYYSVSDVEKVSLENYIVNLGFIFDFTRVKDASIQSFNHVNFFGQNIKKENLFSKKNIEKYTSYALKKERSREENNIEEEFIEKKKTKKKPKKRKESLSDYESFESEEEE